MSDELATRVIEIIAEQALLQAGDLSPDMKLADIGLDSLGLVETIFAIEEAFEVSVPFNANAPEDSPFDLSTIGSVIEGVEVLVAARA